MKNWVELGKQFERFNEEITQIWIDDGFTVDQARKWLEIKRNKYWNFDYQSSYFIIWLINEKKININDYKELNNNQKVNLNDEFRSYCLEKNLFSCNWCQKYLKKSSMFYIIVEFWKPINFCSPNCQTKWNNENVAQNYLDHYYPQNGICIEKKDIENFGKIRSQITQLYLSGWEFQNKKWMSPWNQLIGTLNLSDFINLESLNCSNNLLTEIILPINEKLTVLNCTNNSLTSLNLFNNNQIREIDLSNNNLTNFPYQLLNCETLSNINIGDNNLEETNLEIFSKLINLEYLSIGNNFGYAEIGKFNQFFGSLRYLQNCNKLQTLYIYNTGIDTGL
ncbi:MAG: hypothetical protein AM1032_000018 [Mycoplasmataceae bacterium]|nr:MAG: hypothetical protein AM1032_000018 [Mycoplasmataceae bacterium]